MSAIKVGDLVMQIHSACEHTDESMGVPFKVDGILPCVAIVCSQCWHWPWRTGRRIASGPSVVGLSSYRIPYSWRKKIDPGIVEDDVTTPEALTA